MDLFADHHQCGGARPTCAQCYRSNLVCEYLSANADDTPTAALKNQLVSSREILKQHQELLTYLQVVPEHEGIAVLRQLKVDRSLEHILSSVHHRLALQKKATSLQPTRSPQSDIATGINVELNLLHSKLYPFIEAIDTNATKLDVLFPQTGAISPLLFTRQRASKALTATSRADSQPPFTIDVECLPLEDKATVGDALADARGAPIFRYCDDRLNHLEVSYWTAIPIDNEFVACILSHYLIHQHAIFGCFDPETFLSDLVNHKIDFCSPFLFAAVMALACVS